MWDKTMKKMDYFLLICSKVIFSSHLPVNPAIYEAACKLVTKWLRNRIVAIPYMFPIRFLTFHLLFPQFLWYFPCFPWCFSLFPILCLMGEKTQKTR